MLSNRKITLDAFYNNKAISGEKIKDQDDGCENRKMPWLGLAFPKLGRFASFYSDLNGWWVWCEFSSLQVVSGVL